MRRFLLSFLIIILFCSPCFGNKLDDRQLKESYAKSADVTAQIDAAVANISTLSTVEVSAAETLAVGDVVSLLNSNDVITAKKTDNTNVAGVVSVAANTGENTIVILKGIAGGLTGLVEGASYYRQTNYSLGTNAVSINGSYIFVGYAKSSTEIVLD